MCICPYVKQKLYLLLRFTGKKQRPYDKKIYILTTAPSSNFVFQFTKPT